ncbi:MAG: hypothetical protein LUE21_04335, partial [Oscillospiraceae bacterium]|nr:hypothetical protein [Oscillospiraceae bacterium]
MIDTGLESGGTLTERLAGLTPDQAVKLGRELCVQLPEEPEGFHGGVWPGNIHMDWEGKAVLGEPDHSAAAGRTADQVEYVAPEYFWDNIAAAAADVYAVALLVYAGCCKGRLPFQPAEELTEKDRSDALRRRMKGEPIPRPEGISDPLWTVLEKALSYEEENRYLTARELLTALSDTDEALPSLEAAAAGAAAAAAVVGAQEETISPEGPASEETVSLEEPGAEEAAPTEDAPAPDETAAPEEALSEDIVPEEDTAAPEEASLPEDTDIEETAPAEDAVPEKSDPEEAPSQEGDIDWTEDLEGLSQETARWEEEMVAAAAGLPIQEELAQAAAEQAASADTKRQYTVQKDFEKTRRSRREPSMAPAAQRKKKKSLLGPVLSVIGAAVLLIVVPALVFGGNGDGELQQTSESFTASPATAEPTITPITIT